MAPTSPILTVESLKVKLRYCPDTGVFFSVRTDKPVGRTHNNVSPNGTAYVAIRVCGRSYLAHRLAWFYIYGKWPDGCIDHINSLRNDNRIVNLRDVSLSVNQHNRHGAQKSSQIGLQGVKRNGLGWSARIKVGGRAMHLGTFATPELAHEAYLKAKAAMHFDAQQKGAPEGAPRTTYGR